MASFLGEIKRRKVFQVAAVYLVVAWLIVQIVATIEAPLRLPDWVDTLVIVLLGVGFPVALVLSWAFDITSEGVVRDSSGAVQSGGRRIEYVLIALLVFAVGWVIYRVEFGSSTTVASVSAEVLPNSVAVLPFENLSPNPDNEYFAAGIHEEILGQLAKIRDLSVISRTSVLPYAETDLSVPEIAANLNVEAVMEGSVRFADGLVRIQAQLIDAATDQHLWAEAYERPLSGIFAIQADIAEQIAAALEAELLPSEQTIIERPLTSDSDAHRLYLRAISLVEGYMGPALTNSVADFDRYLNAALELDPDFARVHALKALRYASALAAPRELSGPSYADIEQLAVYHAERARALDPTEGLAYNALAQVHEINWRGAEAQAMHERALALSPNDPDVLNDFSSFYMRTGRHEDAIRLARRLLELDPIAGPGWMGFVQGMAGNYAEAVDYARLALDRGGPELQARLDLVLSLVRLGDEQAANEQLDLLGGSAARRIAYFYGSLGRIEQFERFFGELEALSRTQSVGPGTWALLHLSTGNYAEALAWLNRAADSLGPSEGADALHWIAHNTIGDPALERPEFVEIRERLRFQEWPINPRPTN